MGVLGGGQVSEQDEVISRGPVVKLASGGDAEPGADGIRFAWESVVGPSYTAVTIYADDGSRRWVFGQLALGKDAAHLVEPFCARLTGGTTASVSPRGPSAPLPDWAVVGAQIRSLSSGERTTIVAVDEHFVDYEYSHNIIGCVRRERLIKEWYQVAACEASGAIGR